MFNHCLIPIALSFIVLATGIFCQKLEKKPQWFDWMPRL